MSKEYFNKETGELILVKDLLIEEKEKIICLDTDLINDVTTLEEEIEEIEEIECLREAKKFMGLMEAFGVSADGMEENLVKNKNEIITKVTEERKLEGDVSKSIIVIEEMVDDFQIIRKVLRNTLEKIDLVIDKFGRDMAASSSEDISAAFVTSFAELVKSSNDTAKNLSNIYLVAAKTQVDVKRLLSEVKDMEDKEGNTTNIQNNFIGTTADILAQLKRS
ncbi:MAG: hypothetical protein ACYDD5_00285 [Sulfuricurvum sp.]